MFDFHKKNLRIGLDIDQVCADFILAYESKYKNEIYHFNFEYNLQEKFDQLEEEFWLNMPSLIDGKILCFIPTCYISSRNINKEITEKWLKNNNFPCKPVFHNVNSKLEVCKEQKLDIFVDDNINHFQELTNAGILTFLMDSKSNKQYNVDPYRLLNLNDLPKKILELEKNFLF